MKGLSSRWAMFVLVCLVETNSIRSARAQSLTVQPDAPRSQEACTIEGQVLNDSTGEGIRKADILLVPAEARTADLPSYRSVTAADGKFTMKGMRPGRYRLSASRNGFLTRQYGSTDTRASGAVLSIREGLALKDMALRLIPHSAISGRILDEDHEPVDGVRIEVFKAEARDGIMRPAGSVGVPAGISSDLGEYRIYGLAPGKYFLLATYRPALVMQQIKAAVNASGQPTPDEHFVPTYYPGVPDLASAGIIEVPAGAHFANVDVTLSKMRTYQIKGRFAHQGADGSEIRALIRRRSATVSMELLTGESVNVDPDGGFTIRAVSPGSYTISAAMRYEGKLHSARIPVEVGAQDIDNLVITLLPPVSIAGRVRVEGDNQKVLSAMRVNLYARDGRLHAPIQSPNLKGDGAFQLSDIGRDEFILAISGLPEGCFVKTMRAGDTDIQDSVLDLTAGPVPLLNILVSPYAGRVTGIVRQLKTGKAASGATVVLVPEDERRRKQAASYATATTDQDGAFMMNTVVPGKYKAFAWESIASRAYMDPEFLAQVESQATSVELQERSRKELNLTLVDAAK